MCSLLDVPVVSVEYKYPNSLMSSHFRSGGAGNVSLGEGDSVMVRCRTDANPPASVAWRRAGLPGVWSTREEVLIEAVGRDEAGIYTCTAHNRLGVSGPREIVLNVECKCDTCEVYCNIARVQTRHTSCRCPRAAPCQARWAPGSV